MAIGYAAFQTNLDVKGNSQITSNWDVEIINVKEGEKTGLAESAKTPTWTKTEASMETNLYQKGDSMSYIVTIENKGSFDAKLDNINLGKGTNEEAVNITFSGYTKGQTLFKGTTTDITVTISYNPNYEGGETSSEVNTDFEFSQAEGGTITPTTDHLVTYDYLTNGGTSSNSENEYLPEGSNINLDYTAEKAGYEFVGWNTNASAREGLKDIRINEDTTLYAIFKKDLNVTYEMGEGVTSTEKEAEVCSLYNNDKTCEITLPNIEVNPGYGVNGWYNGETNVGMPNSKYNVNNDTTLTAKAIQTDKKGPTINFDPNSQSNYTNGTDVDINLEDETGIKEGQEISYAWSTSNTESPFTEGSTALGEVNGTGVVIDIYEGMATHYDFKKQGNTWVNTNKGIPMSYSALKVRFALDKTSNFSFDFISSCDDESGLMVFLTEDGVSPDYENIIGEYTGSNNSTFTKTLDPGNYEIYITYVTTYGNTTDYDDTLKISNITIDGMPVEGLPIQTSQIGNKEGAKSATVTLPKSLSSSYTGTYYLWVKGGIEDVLGNVSEDKVSGAFKFDNSAPTVSVSTSSTTNSITVTANASSLSGITKYEFSMDGETWYPSNSNIYTFTGLDADTRYTVGVRVTNGIGKTSMTNTREYTETIPIPTFTESGTSEKKTITITYPEGCGSTYTCSYIKDDGQPVEVNSQTVNVDFTSDGTLIGIVSDGTSENSNVYEVEMLGTMRSWTSSSTSDFHSRTYSKKITSAEVVDYKEVPDNAVKSWDVSEKGNGSVMAWVIDDPDNSGYYKLYIGGVGGVKAGTSLAYMFYGHSNSFSALKTVDLTKLDTSQVTDMSFMFDGCSDLTILDLSNFDTSQVTDMHYMFRRCSSLTALDVSNFDTSNVTNMASMFNYCNSLTELDLSNFDTSQVTDMRFMFNYCNSLTALDVSNFDTSNVTNMASMFNYCNSLTELDLSGFDTSQVIDMSNMFGGYAYGYSAEEMNLKNIIFGEQWDTSKVRFMDYMFAYCNHLTELDLSNFDTSQVTDMSYMFYNCSLTELDLSNFDTSQVTDMSYMFYNCSLIELDISNFDTSKVKNMSSMFQSCSSLTNLDLSNFNTSQVTDMSYMFRRCSSLTSLDISNFDTSQVTYMSYMFSGCSSLTNLDLSSFNTSNVTGMSYMFSGCSSFTSLDLSNFDTSKVKSMFSMFQSCSSLTNLDLSNFDTSQVTDMSFMFESCSSLTNLDLSSFDTRKVTDMDYMFRYASALKVIYVGPNWTTDSATTTDMFNNCGVSEVTLKP